MNECDFDDDPLYHFKVENYLKNKGIFGSQFMSVSGPQLHIEWIKLEKLHKILDGGKQ